MNITPESKFRFAPKKEQISSKTVSSQTHHKHKYIHMHDQTELLFIKTETDAIIFNNGTRTEVRTPAVVIHRAGSYHSTDTTRVTEAGYASFCVFFNEHYLKQIPEALLHSDFFLSDDCLILPITAEQMSSLGVYLDLIRDSDSNEKKLYLLLIVLCEIRQMAERSEVKRCTNRSNYIFEVTHYLFDHYEEPMTTGELAAKFHVSVSKINLDFHRITGQTPKEFCLQLRLNRSMEMLAEGKTAITEIAYQCGFSSESYYIQLFRKRMGCTPMAYRKKCEENRGN